MMGYEELQAEMGIDLELFHSDMLLMDCLLERMEKGAEHGSMARALRHIWNRMNHDLMEVSALWRISERSRQNG